MLSLWDTEGAIEKQYKIVGDAPGRDIRGLTLDIQRITQYVHNNNNTKLLNINDSNTNKNNQILISLGNKDLLYVLSADNFGSGVEAKTKGLTEFGKTFLKFIKKY